MDFNQYFQCHERYFWQWEDDEDIIAIPEGSTIAYRVQAVEVLEHLNTQGIPPFGALLLAFIALNPRADSNLKDVYKIACARIESTDNLTVSSAITFLERLAAVPDLYKSGEKRLLLLQTIFKNCHNIASPKSKILDDLARTPDAKYMHTKAFTHTVFNRDFYTISLLGNRYPSTESIIEQIAGVPNIKKEIIEIPQEEIKTTEKPDFITDLIENESSFHVGALVKRIWSGLNIPFHSALPSAQPLGGVSDLTNKGDFSRLLISEFANEDMVLMSRLANNEALYIQREIPPESHKMQRIILIDVSLKNWGTPKTVAFATMLAIAKHPKTDMVCSVFAIGKHYTPVGIDTVDEVIDGLMILELGLDASEGLTAFFKDYKQAGDTEIFLITEPTTLKEVPMLRTANEYHSRINHWIYTSATGDIDIYKKQQNSKKHLQHLLLPLQELWTKTTKKRPQKPVHEPISTYPILFKSSSNMLKILDTSDGAVFQITKEKTLMRHYDSMAVVHEKGWEILAENLAFVHGDLEIGLMQNGEYILLMYNPNNKQITLLNITTSNQTSVLFENYAAWNGQNFVFENDAFRHVNYHGAWLIDANGDITKTDKNSRNESIERVKNITALRLKYSTTRSIFKNIHEIFINQGDALVFNTHELHLTNNNHFKLMQRRLLKQITAERIADNVFQFSDGSQITVHKSGMLILKSSNPDIETVFVSSVLDNTLGVATESVFSGNTYYYKDSKFDLVLEGVGNNEQEVLRFIGDAKDITRPEAVEIIDNLPYTLYSSISRNIGLSLRNTLVSKGASAKLTPTADIKQLQMESRRFYDTYILPFVEHIKSQD
jgi:hypothetical protein